MYIGNIYSVEWLAHHFIHLSTRCESAKFPKCWTISLKVEATGKQSRAQLQWSSCFLNSAPELFSLDLCCDPLILSLFIRNQRALPSSSLQSTNKTDAMELELSDANLPHHIKTELFCNVFLLLLIGGLLWSLCPCFWSDINRYFFFSSCLKA